MSDVNKTLVSLIENVEDEDGEWGVVYLDNARLPGQSGIEFRAHLSALAKRGIYKPIDGYAFGKVRIDEAWAECRSATDECSRHRVG